MGPRLAVTLALRSAVAIGVAVLVACGSGPVLAPAGAIPGAIVATPKGPALVYVSNSYENSVYVFSYPKLELVATLTGFKQPEGECVDAAGDVWIANSLASQLVEYAHGSTTPKATLADTGYFPYACSVDPQTGDLAVVNEAANPVPGSLSIYNKAAGTPHVYTDDSLSIPLFDAYDAKGALYVDGIRGFYYPDFALARFRHKTFTNIELNHTVISPGALAVVGSRLEVGDAWRYAHSVYGFRVQGLQGHLVGTTRLLDTDVVQEFAIAGNSLIAANVNQKQGSAMVFNYPKGGPPKRTFGTKQLQVGPIGVVVSRSIPVNTAHAARVADTRRSWIDPEAKRETLVYISDAQPGAGTVYVFSYPALKLAGTLTGFVQPLGECADAAGDVWIVDYSTSLVSEYAHGATKPRATLNDPDRRPYSCAVDPKSGDLAVANIFGPSYNPGGLSIYHKARGRPHFYVGRSLYESYFDAYDAGGNLYVDGLTQLYHGVFAIARFDGRKFTALTLNRSVGFPGGVAVVGSNVNVGDQTYDANVVYQFAFSGSKGKLVGSTPLAGASDVRQFAIVKDSLVAGNGSYSLASGLVFKYPAGGWPTKTFGEGTFRVPLGTAVSPAVHFKGGNR